HGRIIPRNPVTRLTLPDGNNLTCRLIDMSLSGAAVATDQRPAIGLLVTLGKVQGRVVRHLEQGFAVEFTRLQHPDVREDGVTGAGTGLPGSGRPSKWPARPCLRARHCAAARPPRQRKRRPCIRRGRKVAAVLLALMRQVYPNRNRSNFT